MERPNPKVSAGAVSSGLAGAFVVVLLWLTGLDPTVEQATALTALVAAGGSLAGGYFKKEPRRRRR